MKKEWIAEALYIVAALAFFGIFLLFRKNEAPGKEVYGEHVPTVAVLQGKKDEPTKAVPEASTLPTPGSEEIPTGVVPEPPLETPAPGNEAKPTDTVAESLTETPTPGSEAEPTDVPVPTVTVTPEPTGQAGTVQNSFTEITVKNEDYEMYNNEGGEWWFLRKTDHVPSGSGERFSFAPYDAYYLDKEATEEDKIVYLTFDCGYENGFMPTILDTLAEKNVKVMFFLTKDFVVDCPEYVKRMKEEGHLIGNHTVRHLASPSLTPEELQAELEEVQETVLELTGYSLDPFFRPPMGAYSERTLKVTQDMGYSTIFWSIAYYDYDTNDQPGKEYVVDHFNTYHHNGAVILMHSISESNAEALGDVIDLWRSEGYRFAMLTELVEK